MRTYLAYLISPVITSLVISALHYGLGIESMIETFFFVSLFTFPVSGGIAVISHLVLRKLKRINLIHYSLAGAFAASPITILGAIGPHIDLATFLLPTLTGSLIGALIILIKKPENPTSPTRQ